MADSPCKVQVKGTFLNKISNIYFRSAFYFMNLLLECLSQKVTNWLPARKVNTHNSCPYQNLGMQHCSQHWHISLQGNSFWTRAVNNRLLKAITHLYGCGALGQSWRQGKKSHKMMMMLFLTVLIFFPTVWEAGPLTVLFLHHSLPAFPHHLFHLVIIKQSAWLNFGGWLVCFLVVNISFLLSCL